jgi:predicted acylesterase/phospholipase RssA
MDHTKRPLVLYFSAGAMSGVFSAGLSKAFEEAKLLEHVDSIYGNSAGSLAAAYYLSGQVETGAQLYWEDLDGIKYIQWSRLPMYVGGGFANMFRKNKKKLLPVFDIDYIENIIRTRRSFNFKAIQDSGVHLYMIAYNLANSSHDYLEVKEEGDLIPALRATAGGHPAYPHSEKIHGNMYVDGGTIDDERRIASLIERHPDKEIVCVLNNPKWKAGKFKNLLNKVSIAVVMLPFFGVREAYKTAQSDFSNLDVERMKADHPYLHFIANDLVGYQMSTNPDHHKMLYKRGYELGREFLLSNALRTIPPPLLVSR